ncbi:hypothetical protein ISP15_16255 [Dyella jejuensis]|uniref:Uncharacterized protein n=1 Tax=Dyella jejuensis TaxID=1432009 RepID=A0ABW8JLA5_9GAMM
MNHGIPRVDANPGYHVFGVCDAQDYCLFVDYVADELDGHEKDLLQRLQHASDRVVHEWWKKAHHSAVDIFEIECVDGATEAEQAVAFWREYFHALGETIIQGGHVCDRWA